MMTKNEWCKDKKGSNLHNTLRQIMKCHKPLHDRYPFNNVETKMLHYRCNFHIKKSPICKDIKYIIKQIISIKTQYLVFSFKI